MENENTKLGVIYILGETLGKRTDLSEDLAQEMVSNLMIFLQDASSKVICKAVEALANLQSQPKEYLPEKVLQALFSLLNMSEPTVKRAAVNALYKLKWENLPGTVVQALFSGWIQTLGDKTVARLLSIQPALPDDITQDLKNLLHSKDEMIRAAAAIALRSKNASVASPAQAA